MMIVTKIAQFQKQDKERCRVSTTMEIQSFNSDINNNTPLFFISTIKVYRKCTL